MIAIVSSSLNAQSNSRILAQEARRVLEQDGHEIAWIDLRDHPLPLCDAGTAYRDPQVAALSDILHRATAIIVATPIYNFDNNAAMKNLIELTGDRAWENKVVGFLCAAGSPSSYMSIMAFANSLMLDFRSIIVPRFVYATGNVFSDGRLIDADQLRRVAELARSTARMGLALKAA